MQAELNLFSLATTEGRWARFGPYYAMFPLDLVVDVVKKYTAAGEAVLDPFAGRFTSVYVSAVLGRSSLGVEINPIGWLYGKAKTSPPPEEEVTKRAAEVYKRRHEYQHSLDKMPNFFRMCYCDEVLLFLLAARDLLNWQADEVDAALVTFILVYLHGKLGSSLSNQMQISKALGVNYSIKWWKQQGLEKPPEINPLDLLVKRISWRYEKGIPLLTNSDTILGDSSEILENLKGNFSLLLTSPPYQNVTSYYADQWLRFWMLGGPARQKNSDGKSLGRFISKNNYVQLLNRVFSACRKLMAKENTVYVRTDSRKFTLQATKSVLSKHFPKHRIQELNRPHCKKRQTEITGNRSKSNGEVDLILSNRV